MACPFSKLTVIGLGLLGGSYVMAARSAYPTLQITGVDPDPSALQFALAHGLVNNALPALPKLPENLGNAAEEGETLVVLACHLSESLRQLEAIAPLVKDKPITVTDIGSCKRDMVTLGEALLPTQFIGGHPMAGRERSGIAHATALLFANKAFLFCPTAQQLQTPAIQTRLKLLSDFVSAFGAIPKQLDAATHDEAMAYVSHLPQLYAVLLTNLLYENQPGKLLTYHGGGIDDQLRLSASPYAMWGDVFARNADNLKPVLKKLRQMLDRLEQDLDQPGMADWFNHANQVHQVFTQLMHTR